MVRTKGIIYKGQDSFHGETDTDLKLQLESQVNSLLKYKNEQLMVYAAGLDLPDNRIKVLYPQYLEANRKLDDLKIGALGENHPTRVAQAEQAQSLLRQLDEAVVSLRATLQAKLASESLNSVEANNLREEAIKRGLDAQDYIDAKREFETDQQLLDAMKLKQIKEKSGR